MDNLYYDCISEVYNNFVSKKWNKVYIALDIHGTCADSNYREVCKRLYENCIEPLKEISHYPEVSIILYSCCHKKDQEEYLKLFEDNGIKISYFNENPEVPNTPTGCFDIKFYYNLLVDDKAFFKPKHWNLFLCSYKLAREKVFGE
jgi:hypothetical protein